MSTNPIPFTGSKSVSGTAVQLVSISTPVIHGTKLVAAKANTGNIYVGFNNLITAGGTAATDGYQLQPGVALEVPPIVANNSSLIYVISDGSSQTVFFLSY